MIYQSNRNMIKHLLFFISLTVRYDKWQQYTQELEELNLSVENFTVCVM